jgi:hypothetical protein
MPGPTKKKTKTAGKKTPKKKTPSPKPKPKPKPEPDPHQATATSMFREVRTLTDLVGRTARMMRGERPVTIKIVNVDLSAGVYLLRIKGDKGIFVIPIDDVHLQVV